MNGLWMNCFLMISPNTSLMIDSSFGLGQGDWLRLCMQYRPALTQQSPPALAPHSINKRGLLSMVLNLTRANHRSKEPLSKHSPVNMPCNRGGPCCNAV